MHIKINIYRIVKIKNLLLYLLMVLTMCKPLSGQHLIIYGKMKIKKGELKGSRIRMMEDGQLVNSYSPENSGKFEINMKYSKNYILEFVKNGYVTKRLSFNTDVPDKLKNEVLGPIDFTIELFPQAEGYESIVFKNPVGKIEYFRNIRNFSYDVDYSRKMGAKLDAEEEKISRLNEKHEREKLKAQQEAEEKARLEAERKRLAELQKREEERRKAEEEKRRLEAEREAEEKARLLAQREALKKAEAEQRRQDSIAEAQRLAKIKKENEAHRRAEEEKRRQDSIKKAQEQEKKRQLAEQRRKEMEAELARQREEELARKQEELEAARKRAEKERKRQEALERQRLELERKKEALRKAREEQRRQDSIREAKMLATLQAEKEARRKALEEQRRLDSINEAKKLTELDKANLERERREQALREKRAAEKAAMIAAEKQKGKERLKATLEAQKQAEIKKYFAKQSNQPSLESIRETFVSDYDKKYTIGKTVETEEAERWKITRVVLKKDLQADTYIKIEHDWGAKYYFRMQENFDGKPEYYNISAKLFNLKTNIEN